LASRLLPSDKFTDNTLIESMIDGMLASDFSQILAVTPFAFKNFDQNGTSINPAWRNAVWHVRVVYPWFILWLLMPVKPFQSLMSFNWNFDSTLQQRVATYKKLTSLWATVRARTPGAGVYFVSYLPLYDRSKPPIPKKTNIRQTVLQNEADVYEPDYTNAFWGSNYPKLLAIKRK